MREHLSTLGVVARRFLEDNLPELGEDWWSRGVIAAMSYQQRQLAMEHGWSNLQQLDLASLLRIIDGNWDHFRSRKLLAYEARNWLKEATSVRNRVAHEAPGAERNSKRDYRDLDTLALLAGALASDSEEAVTLAAARDAVLASPVVPEPTLATMAVVHEGLAPGAQVRLIARPEIVGLVSQIVPGAVESQVRVFHDGAIHAYFESQLELAEIAIAAEVTADEMRAGLTAAELLHPATSRLYSFNSGRIDYEPYQFRPVMKLISADRPRLLIADDVGVGKTIEAGLIIKELQARQPLDSVLVICPKPLVAEGKWRAELKRFDEDFIELDSAALRYCIDETRLEGKWPSRYRKAILPYSLLDEKLLLGATEGRTKKNGLVSLIPPLKFDLVLVDEAHHVRNTNTWRHRVVEHLLESAEAAVLISATPIQLGSNDLYNLLRLLRPDVFLGPAEFDRMREPNTHLARAEMIARSGGDDWQAGALVALEAALSTAWGSTVMLTDPRSQAARDLLEEHRPSEEQRVRAVRALQNLNTFAGLINRTRRRDIGAFTVRHPEAPEVEFTLEQATVHEDLIALCARIIATRQPTQSIEFLLSTLRRQASSSLNGLAPFVADMLAGRLAVEELSEADLEDGEYRPDLLAEFGAEIQALAVAAAALKEDPKLNKLLEIVRDKQSLPNNKLLVFSTFRHTLNYLLPALENADVRVGLVHGGVPDRDRRELRSRFALDKSRPDAIDVLLSSEVGTEGLDNQFCDALVNYDIPWNPMRIEQRIGRIDRRGQKSETVSITNLVVSGTVDYAIYHRCLERIGIFNQALGGSEEILGELTKEMRAIGDNLTLTPSERDEMLRKLAENKLARIQEQAELEEREGALFGLAVGKLDEEGVEAAASPWLVGPRLAGMVTRYLFDQGYERATTLFDKPVGVLRPDKAVRTQLLADVRGLGSSGAAVTRWTQWLESSEQSRRLTFDTALADDPDVELMSPTHPLVRAAAKHVGGLSAGSVASLSVASSELPAGTYPFAVYGWTALGVRSEFEIKVLSPTPEHDETIARLLLTADQGDIALSSSDAEALESRHYQAWAEERAGHIDRTGVHVAGQLASLKLSYSARVAQLEDQLAAVSDERIQRIRESQLRTTDEDYERRTVGLSKAVDRCDVTTTLLCSGVLEVR